MPIFTVCAWAGISANAENSAVVTTDKRLREDFPNIALSPEVGV
jgi:hypothetical protein